MGHPGTRRPLQAPHLKCAWCRVGAGLNLPWLPLVHGGRASAPRWGRPVPLTRQWAGRSPDQRHGAPQWRHSPGLARFSRKHLVVQACHLVATSPSLVLRAAAAPVIGAFPDAVALPTRSQVESSASRKPPCERLRLILVMVEIMGCSLDISGPRPGQLVRPFRIRRPSDQNTKQPANAAVGVAGLGDQNLPRRTRIGEDGAGHGPGVTIRTASADAAQARPGAKRVDLARRSRYAGLNTG